MCMRIPQNDRDLNALHHYTSIGMTAFMQASTHLNVNSYENSPN